MTGKKIKLIYMEKVIIPSYPDYPKHYTDKAIGKCISVAEVVKKGTPKLKQENQIFSTSEPQADATKPPVIK